ncbi:MAG: DUF996 domain-containing protein [Thaumarchaeota archaeon]|nr:DUF996 domain-containing protein [Nitrososphaerota archaeon]
MGSLSTARTFGGIGSILILLFIVPVVGTLLSVIGWILVLIAVNNIADVVGDRSIFRDAIIAVVLAIVGIVVGVAVVFGSFARFAGLNGLNMFSGLDLSRNLNSTSFTSGQVVDLSFLIVGVVGGLALIWVFYLVSAIFLRRTFTKVASRLNVKMFATAALLYLIGAALTIILIGLVVLFIADILMVVAFFSMPDDTSMEPPPTPITIPPPPPPPGA